MKRRGFLKGLIGLAATVGLVKAERSGISAPRPYDPKFSMEPMDAPIRVREYGEYQQTEGDPELGEVIIEVMKDRADEIGAAMLKNNALLQSLKRKWTG